MHEKRSVYGYKLEKRNGIVILTERSEHNIRESSLKTDHQFIKATLKKPRQSANIKAEQQE